MAVQIFRSTDPGAPSYTNVAGTFIAILDYCLLGLGWTKNFLGTNQASYTQPTGSNGLILQVDDSSASYAGLSGWTTLTSFNTGTGEFISSSSTAVAVDHALTSTPVPWRLITNGNIFHFVQEWNTASHYYGLTTFGDFVSYIPNDKWNTTLCGNYANGQVYASYMGQGLANAWNVASSTAAVARAYDQIRVNPGAAIITDYAKLGASGSSANSNCPPYPDPISGALNMSPVWIGEPTAVVVRGGLRGLMPGIWTLFAQNAPFNDGDTFTAGAGSIAGRTFEIVGINATIYGQFAIETSNTWGGF